MDHVRSSTEKCEDAKAVGPTLLIGKRKDESCSLRGVTRHPYLDGASSLLVPLLMQGATIAVMQFKPKGLIVAVVFFGLLWFTLERGFGFVALAAVIGVALDAAISWGLLADRPWPRWRRVR